MLTAPLAGVSYCVSMVEYAGFQRFLLIAPVRYRAHSMREPVEPTVRVTRFISRDRFSTALLDQVWSEEPPRTIDAVEIPKAAFVEVAEWELFICDAYLETRDLKVCEIEEMLTATVESICLDARGKYPLWVSRTVVGDGPPGWLDHSAVEFREGDATFSLGWGNNAVSVRLMQDSDAWENAVRGLVDAQALYCHLDATSTETGQALLKLSSAGEDNDAADTAILTAARMSRQLIVFDLAADEVLTHLQGLRRLCAESHLRVWKADALRERTRRRVEDLQQLAEEAVRARASRYQRVVEAILFALALTSVLQTALAVIQTAFSGGVSTIPGEDRGVLQWIRTSNLDLLLGMTSILLVITAAFVYSIQRGHRARES